MYLVFFVRSTLCCFVVLEKALQDEHIISQAESRTINISDFEWYDLHYCAGGLHSTNDGHTYMCSCKRCRTRKMLGMKQVGLLTSSELRINNLILHDRDKAWTQHL